tara:strand:- start:1297 stop:4632 length:3336 start_codon:yes stop_codon:yes gene_type:complete
MKVSSAHIKSFFILIVSIIILGCDNHSENLFVKIDSSTSNVNFNNQIIETDTLNILNEEYVFNGGGVAAADYNNDGKTDLFFTGNQQPNRLYLNQGEFVFKDISESAKILAQDKWSTGVTYVDINNDNLLDIYVCAAMYKENRRNMLFINKGVNPETGIISFEEKASEYGIDDSGNSMGAVFFDYNKDGFIDLFVLNNEQSKTIPTNYRKKIKDGTAVSNDRLYKNNGDGTFSDVTIESGITIEGFGLGVAISDVNYDGWPDIFIGNDYITNDLLYINNQDGTFSNKIRDFIKHQSMFSMGVDISDFNNDGYPDIVSLDMLGETNYRKKTTISYSNYETVLLNKKWDYQTQHSRNMLHLGNGNNVPFSEIGMLSEIYQTDWSWSPLFFDADNDGLKDLFVTNGFPRDITDKDFSDFRQSVSRYVNNSSLLDCIPVVKKPNYSFKNNGDLTFSDKSYDWGLGIDSFSNGAAYADLDNDGDLDYIINNINDEAFIFKNTSEKFIDNKSFIIRLKGPENNITGIGSKVVMRLKGGKFQTQEIYHTRGYMSAVENIIHFGYKDIDQIESLEILWPDGSFEKISSIGSKNEIQFDYQNSIKKENAIINFPLINKDYEILFSQTAKKRNINFKHSQIDQADFHFQRLLPRKISESSPKIITGNFNKDKLSDFVVSNSKGSSPKIFLQNNDNSFNEYDLFDAEHYGKYNYEDLIAFDYDLDNDLDIIFLANKEDYSRQIFETKIELLRNNGEGKFELESDKFPKMNSQGSIIRINSNPANEVTDIFIGGKTRIMGYPYSDKSLMFRKINGEFKNVTDKVFGSFKPKGIIKDAHWVDLNNDKRKDLVIVSEFYPIQIYLHKNGKLVLSEKNGIENYSGWWQSIESIDSDSDGDMDLLIGNIGSNNHYNISKDTPVTLFSKDFDENGFEDPIIFSFSKSKQGNMKMYPVTFWGNLNRQSPFFRKKFKSYKQFGSADFNKIFSKEELKGAIKLEVNFDKTCLIENLGNGKFKVHILPLKSQFAPIYDFEKVDLNNDNLLDLLLIGNDYGNEPFIGPYDALSGLVLINNGGNTFEVMEEEKSNFIVPGNARDIEKMTNSKGDNSFLVSQNSGELLLFEMSKK